MSEVTQPIPFLRGTISISSSLSLTEIAESISTILGIRLEEDTHGLYEEIPAYYADALGLRFVVMHSDTDKQQYVFQVHPQFRFSHTADFHAIDIAPLLVSLLENLLDAKVFPMG